MEKFKTVKQAYEYIYNEEKGIFHRQGLDEDKASRLANIKAVQNAWFVFNIVNGIWSALDNKQLIKDKSEIRK